MLVRLPLVGTRISAFLGDRSDVIRPVHWHDDPRFDNIVWQQNLVDGTLDLDNAEAEFQVLANDSSGQTRLDALLTAFLSDHLGIGGIRQWGAKGYIDEVRNRRLDTDGTFRDL